MIGGIAAAAAIVLFVTAHEAGHFFAAKAVGMKATEFFFGFGPRIWSIRVGETEYGLKAIPLGGYVRIVGMNPLEAVPPSDLGRTYREKQFWEKSVVVLAGVSMNFLLAFILFFGVVMVEGVTEAQPVVETVVPTIEIDGVEVETPAVAAGVQRGDVLVMIGDAVIERWEDVPSALRAAGEGPVTVVVERAGGLVTLEADLVLRTNPDTGQQTGFLGVAPTLVTRDVGVVESFGLAGRQVWDGIGFTFGVLGDMFRPSSLAQYVGVLLGDTDVPDEIRPVSAIGIVNLGTQADTFGIANFVTILALVNVILATLNVLPLFPLDGGHFAVALYEKATGRQADVRRLAPIAAAVIVIFGFLGLVAIILDIVNPIRL